MTTKIRLFTSLLVLAALFLQACGRQLPIQEACGFVQNSQARRVSWKDQPVINFYVHESVSVEYLGAIEIAAMHWNEMLGRPLIQIEPGRVSGENEPKKDNYSVIYMLDNWEEEKSSEQARTTVYWSGARIYESDIRINNKNFKFFTGIDSESDKVHMESLMVHELGHALGLAHSHHGDTVMKPFLASGDTSREVPGDTDFAALACEYI